MIHIIYALPLYPLQITKELNLSLVLDELYNKIENTIRKDKIWIMPFLLNDHNNSHRFHIQYITQQSIT